MNSIEERILDEYIYQYRVEAESYRMMGKMLDKNLVQQRLEQCGISDLYLYGGTYLAAQLCRCIGDNANLKGIVDKNGRSAVEVNVPIISLDDLRNVYQKEKIIITPPRFYQMIKLELMEFVRENNIIFLGEFLEGLN